MGNLALACIVAFAKAKESGAAAPEKPADPAPEAEAKTTKSIVPHGWKSKGDELSKFVDKQSTGKDGFEYSAFFMLCRKNGVAEDQVKKYEDVVASKAHGGQGRAKMTLRNLLATIARKNGKLVGLDGEEVAINIPKPAVSGAAAKAKETAAA